MNIVLVTSEHDTADEHAVLAELFARGLSRCHVRKPHATESELACWIEAVPEPWRDRLVLHHHHPLASRFHVGGLHWPEQARTCYSRHGADAPWRGRARPLLTSTSCHHWDDVPGCLGDFDSVFFGPVFASISKPGHGPLDDPRLAHARRYLAGWSRGRTAVVALGGVNAETAPRAFASGFDGVAVLGAIWRAGDPVAAWNGIVAAVATYASATAVP